MFLFGSQELTNDIDNNQTNQNFPLPRISYSLANLGKQEFTVALKE